MSLFDQDMIAYLAVKEENKQLRQRVKELEYEEAKSADMAHKNMQLWMEVSEKLAASQLDNLRLRSALEHHQEQTRPIQETIEALSTPTDTEALEKYLADRLELVCHEYKWLDTNPHTVTSGQWSEWEKVDRRNCATTAEDHVAEIQYWIDQGYNYELRKLYKLKEKP